MKFLVSIFLIFMSTLAVAAESPEKITANYFATTKNNPQNLAHFLQQMPKGGELHSHLGGGSLSENLIQYGMKDNLCIDPHTDTVTTLSPCKEYYQLKNIQQHPQLYNEIMNAWSMRNFHGKGFKGHDHFFATFGKDFLLTQNHSADILQEMVQRAGLQNEIYLELLVTPDNNASGLLGKKLGWNPDLKQLRQNLLSQGLTPIIQNISEKISADESYLKNKLQCQSHQPEKGCAVTVRYLYQILREQPPAQVFAQLLAGFEVASKDARVVGINMVQPEDGPISMRDYKLHMKMIAFLHQLYPTVRITLHAGELTKGLVPDAGLRFHIHDAIETAHATRIGHGVDIPYENSFNQLLNEMHAKHILVEINLSSNATILNVEGKNHPILLYLAKQVPIALSTDDEGVIRTTLTEEYQKAVNNYHFSYRTLKNMARNSIAYSFLPGESLWQDDLYKQIKPSCANQLFRKIPSRACHDFLRANEKANLQWQLEKQFYLFEKNGGHG